MTVYALYVVAILVIILLIFSLMAYARRFVSTPGSQEYLWMATGAIMYLLTMLALSQVRDYELAHFLSQLRFVWLSIIPGMGALMALRITQRLSWINRRNLILIWIIPVIVQFVLWTPGLDRLFFTEWNLYLQDGYVTELRTEGLFYTIFNAWNLAMLLIAAIAVVHYVTRVDTSQRRSMLLLILTMFFGSLLIYSGIELGPAPGLRMTPIAIGVMAVGFIFAYRRYDMLSMIPTAYDQIVESVHDAVLVVNHAGRIVNCNPATGKLAGGDHRKLLNKPLSEAFTLAAPIPLTGEPMVDQEFLNGDKTWEVSSLPLGKPNVTGRIVTIRDVTVRKRAERQTAALVLETERSQILSRFIRDASHEFRTPVSVISTSVELLERHTDLARRAALKQRIGFQIERLTRLVEDLQDMVVLDSTLHLNGQPADIHPLLLDCIARAQESAHAKQIRLNVALHPGALVCVMDAVLLDQGLRRLLDNAIRYSEASGTIACSTAPDAGFAVIIIKDSGVGMDSATLSQATQRFFRGDSSHTTAGFGLGLPIASSVIRLHGGTLDIHSAEGEGTTVTIRLPLELNRPIAVPASATRA